MTTNLKYNLHTFVSTIYLGATKGARNANLNVAFTNACAAVAHIGPDRMTILADPGGSQSSRDKKIMGKIGTGVKFSSKARRAPGNIPKTDKFQSKSNSNLLIGRKFPQLSFFRPIREPHTATSDRDPL